jgi:hypothetical protein
MDNGSAQRRVGRLGIWIGVIGAILAIPLVAMQFTDEVAWTSFDFIVAGVLLGAAALTYELTTMNKVSIAYRAAVALAVGTAFALVWANGAVGVLGDEGNAANMIFLAVFAVGFIGTVIAGLKPAPMAHAMAATAVAQIVAALVALILAWGTPLEVALTAAFAGGWFASAFLFHLASKAQNPSKLA